MTHRRNITRIFFVVALILTTCFAVLFFVSWVIDIDIPDSRLEGLGIEALGAIVTAVLAVFLAHSLDKFLEDEFESVPPAVSKELEAVRQELSEIKALLLRRDEGKQGPAAPRSSDTEIRGGS